jgi:hypothetical protein
MIPPHPRLQINVAEQLARSIVIAAHVTSLVGANESRSIARGEPSFFNSLLTADRFTLVDALLGIAALCVVLFHLKAGNHIPSLQAFVPTWVNALVDHGDLGVAIFLCSRVL